MGLFSNPAATISRMWSLLSPLPGGKRIFSTLLGWVVPYSGSISPQVLELEGGSGQVSSARVQMKDRRGVRNHLNCAHAMALANLAEMATGLAVIRALDKNQRAILVGFSVDYLKKGRGNLTGVCRFQLPSNFTEGTVTVEGHIENDEGETVTRALATWKVSPVR